MNTKMWINKFIILIVISIASCKTQNDKVEGQCDLDSNDCVGGDDVQTKAEKYTTKERLLGKETSDETDPDLVKMAHTHFPSQEKNLNQPPAEIDLDSIQKIGEKILGELNVPAIDGGTLMSVLQLFGGQTNDGKKNDGNVNLLQTAQSLMMNFLNQKSNEGDQMRQLLDFFYKEENRELLLHLVQNEEIVKNVLPLLQRITKNIDSENTDDALMSIIQFAMANFNREDTTSVKEVKNKTENLKQYQKHSKPSTSKPNIQSNIVNFLQSSGMLDKWKQKLGEMLFQGLTGEAKDNSIKQMLNILEKSKLTDKKNMKNINRIVNNLLGLNDNVKKETKDEQVSISHNAVEEFAVDTFSNYRAWTLIWDILTTIYEAIQEPENNYHAKNAANVKKYESIIKEMLNERNIKESKGNEYLVTLFGLLRDKTNKSLVQSISEFSDIIDTVEKLQDFGVWDYVITLISATDFKSVRKIVALSNEIVKDVIPAKSYEYLLKALNTNEFKMISNSISSTIKDPNIMTIQQTVMLIYNTIENTDLEKHVKMLVSPSVQGQVISLLKYIKKMIKKADWSSVIMYFAQPDNRAQFFSIFKEFFLGSCIEMWMMAKSTSETVPCLRQAACKFGNRKPVQREPEKSLTFWGGALTAVGFAVSTGNNQPDEIISVYFAMLDGAAGVKCQKKFKC